LGIIYFFLLPFFQLIGATCVQVKWDNGALTHLPNTAVKRTIPIEGKATTTAAANKMGPTTSRDE
jgi:hypothetical protein